MSNSDGLVLAQNLAEYGALSGGASALHRFLNAAEHAIRTPETGIPLGLLALVVAYFLLRRR
ncbi:MAG: hypothetical protein ABIX28_08825 [Vicinamibacterales bacterium]